MKSPAFPRRLTFPLTACCAALTFTAPGRAETAAPAIVPDVIYGHKAGMALTYDVIKPAQPNGAAVLFMVSGGWVSIWADPAPFIKAAMGAKNQNAFGMILEHGFTLVLVRHGSSPYFKVPDAVADVRRAVRHFRLHAATHGIDPRRLGVFGASAGGHLSLMLGTASDEGNPASADPVEKVSDRVAAVTAYVPPTDLTGYINDPRFPALHFPADQADSVSPLKQVTADDAPSLLVHGAKDTLVIPSHSENIAAAFRKAGVPTDLLIFPEAGHGFTGADEKTAATALVAWFEKYLSPTAAGAGDAPAGVWETKATLPDGGNRPGTLTFRQEDGKLTVQANGEQGERKIDRVKWEDGRLLLEIDMERDGRKGIIHVNAAKTPAGLLTGTWNVTDDSGSTLVNGAWEATKKAPAP